MAQPEIDVIAQVGDDGLDVARAAAEAWVEAAPAFQAEPARLLLMLLLAMLTFTALLQPTT